MTASPRSLSRRHFLQAGVVAGAWMSGASSPTFASGANDEIRLGIIGCGGRGGQLIPIFKKMEQVNIAGLYDPDPGRAAGARNGSRLRTTIYSKLDDLINDDNIDAVVIAACNHWHCLAAIQAMEAGKDVYVEKPLSHTQWEGQQVVAAARKYNRICQVGTQQRSDPMQAEIKKFLHEDKTLGEIQSARVNRYGRRSSIGKRSTPLPIDSKIDYDMWLGPAQNQPIYRDRMHYDWHWDWNTGSGEMGNWGVHVLDDVRNNVFQDKVALPKRIIGGGGRVAWNDAGNTPNVQFAYFDTGSIPVVIGLSNLQPHSSTKHPGPGSGYIAYCEGGRLEGQRGRAVAFDKAGKEIKSFRGTSGEGLHQQNFINAVRTRDASILNTDVLIGHHSTGWCNLANIAFQAGAPFSRELASKVDGDTEIWNSLLEDTEKRLADHRIEIESAQIKLSPVLTFDNKRETFVGDHAEQANRFLKRPSYRKGFEVPEIV